MKKQKLIIVKIMFSMEKETNNNKKSHKNRVKLSLIKLYFHVLVWVYKIYLEKLFES